jgi:hypothetical protein
MLWIELSKLAYRKLSPSTPIPMEMKNGFSVTAGPAIAVKPIMAGSSQA